MMNQISDPARVFLALWPSITERQALAFWQTNLNESSVGRAMHPETLHVTLVFLGDVATDRLESLKLAAEEVSAARFELCFDEVRYWEHNRILYAAPGCMPDGLSRLVAELEKSLLRHHFKFDQRKYQPHVTLLRNAHWHDAPLPTMQTVRWKANEFVLVQRVGSSYRKLAQFPLL